MAGVAGRWDVKSGDGGSIAVWVEGEGLPLVLVHGLVSDHTVFAPLVASCETNSPSSPWTAVASVPVGTIPGTPRSASSATLRWSWMQLRRGLGSRWCLVPARRHRPHDRPRGSHRTGMGLAVRTLRRHRRPHPAHHRIRDPARACRGHVPDRRSNPRRARPRPRRPRPRRPCV